MDPRALIPRIETEELVKYALRILTAHPHIKTIIDIGTGSGVIPLSIAHKSDTIFHIIATDMSHEALDLARKNFTQLKTITSEKPLFLQGDLLRPVIEYFGKNPPESILLTANLPYVLTREVVGDLIHEPKMAFIGGEKT